MRKPTSRPPRALPRPSTSYWSLVVPYGGIWLPEKAGRHTVVVELAPDEDPIDRPNDGVAVVIRCAPSGAVSYRYISKTRVYAVLAAADRRIGLA